MSAKPVAYLYGIETNRLGAPAPSVDIVGFEQQLTRGIVEAGSNALLCAAAHKRDGMSYQETALQLSLIHTLVDLVTFSTVRKAGHRRYAK